jgi:hypothetical protein
MLKTARLAPILLVAWAAPAGAADCLQEIDNLTVEFDLPAAESMAGTQTGSAYYIPPPPAASHPGLPPPPTTTPPGRPGALHSGGGSIAAPPLLPREMLKGPQRTKVQSILQQARSVEALGKEPQCFELLRQAQSITKGNG